MKTIVFLPLTRTNWPIMIRLAKAVGCSGRARAVIILSNPLVKGLSAELDGEIDIAEIPMLPTHVHSPRIAQGAIRRDVIGGAMKEVRRSRILVPLLSWYKSRAVRKQLEVATNLLRSLQARTIVVSGDRNTGFEPAVLRAAKDLGVVSIIPPVAFSATLDGLSIARRQNLAHCVTQQQEFKRKFPNQWRHDPLSGDDLSFFGMATTYAYSRYGMLPENPWVLGGGLSDWILVDSEDVKQRYIELGVDAGKILVTGHPDHDMLSLSMQRKVEMRVLLQDKYQLDPARKIIVLCLPNWAEAGLKPWEWHWRESELLCRHAVSQGSNVLLSLHPSQERGRYEYLEERFPPIRILDERLATVLPAVDIYFTGLSSSTIPWAVLASVPTVIADHYPEKDRIHAGLPGVVYVAEVDQLGDTLARLVSDEASFQSLRRCQREAACRYGTLDGQATVRIVQMLLSAPLGGHGQERMGHAA